VGEVPLRELLDLRACVDPDDLVPAIREVLAGAALRDARFYLADYSQHRLQPLATPGASLDIDATAAGRAYRQLAPVRGEGAGHTLWLPLLNHGSRLGVLGASMSTMPTCPSRATCAVSPSW